MGQRIEEFSIQSGEPLNLPQSKICVLKAKKNHVNANMKKVDLWIYWYGSRSAQYCQCTMSDFMFMQ